MLSKCSLLVVGLGILGCSGEDSTAVVSLAATPATEAPTAADPGSPGESAPEPSRFVLASITIDADGNRVSYAQIVDQLSGDYDNSAAIEAPGNATFLSRGSDFLYGLAESATWVR